MARLLLFVPWWRLGASSRMSFSHVYPSPSSKEESEWLPCDSTFRIGLSVSRKGFRLHMEVGRDWK